MTDGMQALHGTWNITALTVDGNALPAAFLQGAKIDVQADVFVVHAMGTRIEANVVTDVTVTPHTLDLAFTSGPESGKTAPGIYALEGDAWRVCFALKGGARPTAFASAPGTGHVLEELKRA